MKNTIVVLFGIVLIFLSNWSNAQNENKRYYSLKCKDWNCIEQNKNKDATIIGVFQKFTPNISGKGANHMFWNWELLLKDGFSVPIKNTNHTTDYQRFEGKNVQIKGKIFYGIVIGSAEGQNATGFRIDPVEIVEIE
jgi:hypothetical protein